MSKRYTGLLLVCLIALLSLMGCITIYDEKPSSGDSKPASVLDKPVILSFTAGPDSIKKGETVNLSWDVSGSTSVTINPVVGPVGPSSRVLVSPVETTTYTLTATNAAGSSTATVTVTVVFVEAGKPDLIITDIWIQSNIIYYKIKNQGNESSRGSRSYLSVNGVRTMVGYVVPLAPGEEKIQSFSNYQWTYRLEHDATSVSVELIQYTLEVCADMEGTVKESDEGNNCASVVWGQEYIYSFVDFAHMATWISDAGNLRWPIPGNSTTGAAFIMQTMALEDGKSHSSVLATYPQQVSQGWIQGRFAEYYTDRKSRQLMSREIVIPDKAKFTAMVGFKEGAQATGGVKFIFGTMDDIGRIEFAPEVFAAYDGNLDLYEVDLSALAGEKRSFVLRVEAGDSAEQNWAVWLDPKIVQ